MTSEQLAAVAEEIRERLLWHRRALDEELQATEKSLSAHAVGTHSGAADAYLHAWALLCTDGDIDRALVLAIRDARVSESAGHGLR